MLSPALLFGNYVIRVFSRDPSQFTLEGDSYLGLEEFLLLFRGWHISFVSKLIAFVKF
jgi:hypothetical protein